MRTPPQISYNGITIILDKPSRFDKDVLLSGLAGQWFEEECLAPNKLDNCDIRDLSEEYALLPNTKLAILLGKNCNTSNSPPGYPMIYKGVAAVNAFAPQDCVDFRNIESEDEESDDDKYSEKETKDEYPTRRVNYRFWTKWFTRKLLYAKYIKEPNPTIVPYPRLQDVCNILDRTSNQNLYLDIETSRQHRSITCIGFSTDETFPNIYVVPVYRYDSTPAYSDFYKFHRALSLASQRNQFVIHNAGFDLVVLNFFYHILLPKQVYDTMLAQHRCFPEAEKSLSHCIAAWTWQPYHKNVSTEVYSRAGEEKMWEYNGRDVFNLRLIKAAQEYYAEQIHGLSNSIDQANRSLLPYIEMERIGLRLNQLKLSQTARKLELHISQLSRIISILIGDSNFNARSPVQCAKFFHDRLNYPVVKKGDTGKPKMGRKQLYQLLLKHKNPVIPFIIKYRELCKDLSMLDSELFTMI